MEFEKGLSNCREFLSSHVRVLSLELTSGLTCFSISCPSNSQMKFLRALQKPLEIISEHFRAGFIYDLCDPVKVKMSLLYVHPKIFDAASFCCRANGTFHLLKD